MNSYDSYKNRMLKLATIKNFIVRFRVPILAVLALIMALIIAFLSTKGIVLNELQILYGNESVTSVVYGENYEVKAASALFSPAKYEFSHDNGQTWNDVKPQLAGKYWVRSVTEKSFGPGYGEPISFEIEKRPAEFVILSGSVTYGQYPDSYDFKLAGGDTLVATGLSYDFVDGLKDVTSVCANAKTIKIINAAGEDVTFCYDIKTPQADINLNKKNITITPEALKTVYNGKPVEYGGGADEATKTALNGDIVKFNVKIVSEEGTVIEGTPTEAGIYEVEIDQSTVQIFHGETDVTELYATSYKKTQIEIAKLPVTITTQSATKTYDGTPLLKNDGFTSTPLAAGHTLKQASADLTITQFGERANEYTYDVLDANGETVTKNYDVKYVYGKLNVTKREVSITTHAATKEYDGTPLENPDYEITAGILAEGDGERLIESSVTRITNVAESGTKNELAFDIYNGNDEKVTDSYAVTYIYEELTVTKRKVQVKTPSITREYDGEKLFLTEGCTFEESGLAEGEEASVATYMNIINVGSAPNQVTFQIYRNGVETTENYEFLTPNYGTLEITRRKIVMTTEPMEFVYNNVDYTNPVSSFSRPEGMDGEAVLSCHTFVPVEGTVTSVRECAEPVDNVFEVNFFEGETRMDGNYEIVDHVYGKLVVLPRVITIHTASKQKEYDGAPFFYTDEAYATCEYGEESALALGHTLVWDREQTTASVTLVTEGAVQNEVHYLVADAEGNTAVSHNYTIQEPAETRGVILRTQRLIRVTTETSSRVYDANPYSDTRVKSAEHVAITETELGEQQIVALEDSALVAGHEFKAIDFATVINVLDGEVENSQGKVENKVTYSVVLKDGETETDFTANYYFYFVYGKISVTVRPITITSANAEWTYDGGKHTKTDDLTWTLFTETPAVGLVNGQKVVVATATEIEHFVENKENNNVLTYRIVNNGETETDDFTSNYQIETVAGTIKINKRPITVYTKSQEFTYDGAAHSVPEAEKALEYEKTDTAILFALGQKLIPNEGYTQVTNFAETDGKTENNIVSYQIKNADESFDCTEDYEIHYQYGTITINKRRITITTATRSKEYDGEPFTYTADPEPSWAGEGKALVLDHTLVWDESKTTASVTNVKQGEVDNEVHYFVVNAEITENYAITNVWGKISRTQRLIKFNGTPVSLVYNGKEQTSEAGEFVKINEKGEETEGNAFVLNHVQKALTFTPLKNVGSAENKVTFSVVNPADTSDEVNSNYSISYNYATIEITVRPITITALNGGPWTYDGDVHTQQKFEYTKPDSQNVSGLVADPKHTINLLTFTEITNAGIADNVHTYSISDETGTDVTANYDINKVNGTLTVGQRAITVVLTPFAERTYDGTVSAYPTGVNNFVNYATIDLALNEKLEVVVYYRLSNKTTAADPKNAGTYYAHFDIEHSKVTDRNGAITVGVANYNVTCEPAEVVINKRPITITSDNGTFTYNGRGQHKETFTNTPFNAALFVGLLEGHTIKVTEYTTITDVKHSGKPNVLKYAIQNAAGGSEWDNYDVEEVYGTLTVNKRHITITTATKSKEFDGEPFSYTDDAIVKVTGTEEAGLVLTHKLKVTNTPKAPAAVTYVTEGAVNNEVYYIVENEEINENYYIDNYHLGKISRTVRSITVTTLDAAWTYNAEAHQTYDTTTFEEFENYTSSADRLVTGHSLVLDQSQKAKFASITEYTAGGTPNELYFLVKKGTDDLTANYDISYTYGTLTINKRAITITSADETWVYDGAAHSKTDGLIWTELNTEDNVGLLTNHGHEIKVIDKTEITNVSETVAENNVLDYKICNSDGTQDYTKNYEITKVAGTLTITARPITITSASSTDGEFTYDGKAHSKPEVASYTLLDTVKKEGLLTGHSIVVNEDNATTITNFSENGEDGKPNVLEYAIKDASDNDVTGNYAITSVNGKLKIGKRKIIVKTPSKEWEYDGEVHYITEGATAVLTGSNPEVEGLIEGHALKEDGNGHATILDVLWSEDGTTIITKPNTVVYMVYLESDETVDVNNNYEITDYVNGTLKITQRSLTITTSSVTKTYDGEEISGATEPETENEENKKPTFEGLVTGEGHEAVTPTTFIDVIWSVDGSEVISRDNETTYKFTSADGLRDTTKNYKTTTVYGKLKIYPRPITITTPNAEWTYDGEKHQTYDPATLIELEKYQSTADDLVEGHILALDASKKGELSFVQYTKDNGTPNKLFFLVKNGDADVTKNYEITYTYGTLTLNPRRIKVTLKNEFTDLTYGDTLPVDLAAAAGNYARVVLVDERGNVLEGDALVSGETLQVAVYYLFGANTETHLAYADIKNAGKYSIYLDTENCIIYRGGTAADKDEGISNYVLTQEECSFEIAKRPVTLALKVPTALEEISTGDEGGAGENEISSIALNGTLANGVYNGKSYVFPNTSYTITNGKLYYSETLTVGVNYMFVRADSTNRDDTLTAMKDAGVYTITLNKANCLIDGSIDANDNYEISIEGDGISYTIDKKPLKVALQDVTVEYDGTVFSYVSSKDYLTVEGLLFASVLEGSVELTGVAWNAKSLDVGDYTMTFKTSAGDWKVTGGDITSNYTIDVGNSTINKKLTVTPRPIMVTFGNETEGSTIKVEYRAETISNELVGFVDSYKKEDGTTVKGFVNQDEYKVVPVYTYMQGGVIVEAKARGTYDASVELTNAENEHVLSNYAITYVGGGKLIIDSRFVYVEAKCTNEGIEYNGEAFDMSLLDFADFHAVKAGSEDAWQKEEKTRGFLDDVKKENLTVTYTITLLDDEGNPTSEVYTEGTVIHAGTYQVKVEIAAVEGYEIKHYEPCTFTVGKRTVKVQPTSEESKDGVFRFEYSKQPVDSSKITVIDKYGEAETGQAGFLELDRANVKLVWKFMQNGEEVEAPTFVGDYDIELDKPTSVDGKGLIERDYAIETQVGKLKILRRILVVGAGYEEFLYTGEVVYFDPTLSTAYTILAGSLAEGDKLEVASNGKLDPNETTKTSVSILLSSCKVLDESNNDMKDQYALVYNMSGINNAKAVFGEDVYNKLMEMGFRESSFKGKIILTYRTIEVVQKKLDDKYRSLTCTGNNVYLQEAFPLKDSQLIEVHENYADCTDKSVKENEYGLLEGHTVRVYNNAKIGKMPGTYDEWLKCKIYDKNGDVVKGYNIIYVCESGSSVTINPIEITVEVPFSLAARDIATTVAAKDYKVTGVILDGHHPNLEIVSGTRGADHDKDVVFSILNSRGKDQSDYYHYTVKYGVQVTTESNAEIVYDGAEHTFNTITVEGWLDNGHTVKGTGFTVIQNVSAKAIKNEATFTVQNASGGDESATYAIAVVFGEINLQRKKISYVTANNNASPFTYDAEAKTLLSFEEAPMLIAGHTWEADTSKYCASLTDVGSAQNVFSILIKDSNGNDVTSNYEITADYGTLRVKARELSITTASDSWEYNGEERSLPQIDNTKTVGLLSGHTISVGDEYPKITDAGTLTNAIFVFVIRDAAGNDVTKNYDYLGKVTAGTLTVTKKAATITVDDLKVTYSGVGMTGYTGWTLSTTGFIDGVTAKPGLVFTMKGTSFNDAIDAGDYTTELRSYTLVGDKTSNYTITTKNGTLTVEKKALTVTVENKRVEYTGSVFDFSSCTVRAEGLISGTFTGSVKAVASAVNKGTYALEFDDTNWSVSGNNTKNYKIGTVTNGTLTIERRVIAITLKDIADLAYGDTFAGYPTGAGNYAALSKELGTGHALTVSVSFRKEGALSASSPKEVGKYFITLNMNACVVLNGAEHVTDNYSFTQADAENAFFEITQRTVSVALENCTFTYNANAFSYTADGGKTVSATNLASGDTFTGTVAFYKTKGTFVSAITPGTYGITISAWSVADSNGKDVTNNYTIDLTDAELVISARVIRVTLDENFVIDDCEVGYTLSESEYSITGDLLAGDSVRAEVSEMDGVKTITLSLLTETHAVEGYDLTLA